ncbi:MAG: hypothetical protein AMXMBFR37_16560 [Steroidobacteraceae bacterium]
MWIFPVKGFKSAAVAGTIGQRAHAVTRFNLSSASPHGGPMNPNQPVFAGISAASLITSAATLLLLVVGDQLLRRWLRRRAIAAEGHAADASSGSRGGFVPWAGELLRSLIGPSALLLWTYGLHFAIATPLPEADLGGIGVKLLATVDWLRGMLTLVALAWALARLGRVIENRLAGAARRTAADWDDLLLPLLGSAARLMLPLLAVLLAAPTLGISPGLRSLLQNLLSVVLIGCFAFLLMKAVDAGTELLLSRYRIDVPDNLEARAVHTQVTVLRKVAMVAIGLFAVASMLMVFEPVRRLGATLLASAGVAGIMLGFAAQRSIATLLAGFQIAMTQPIRVNDVVIVEGEWGRIEEITLTYVVVAIWDQRRLVLPINYFIEQPFQNWTRSSAEILGTVFLHVDYTVPLAELRSEFERLVRASPLWDGRVQGVQVTDAKESTLELRCLASAADASKAWGLRCELREKLVDWMQRNHPESLPRARAMVSTMGSARGSGVLQPAT